MKANTQIPLSVDFEKGYTDDLNGLAENIKMLVDAGIAGINIEDSQGEDIFLRKLGTIKNYLEKNNQRLFINARTDGFLLKLESPLETTIKRAKLYQDAGADGLFVTAVSDPAVITTISASTSLPLNIVGNPKLASIQELYDCGVRRISMAVLLYNATYRNMKMIAEDVAAKGSLAPLFYSS